MWRFWTSHIERILRVVNPKRIMEIGADEGFNTRRLLAFCRETGARVDVVEPVMNRRLSHGLDQFNDEYVHYAALSLDAIPKAPAADVVLLDGDHNWRTVYLELAALFERAAAEQARPPIVLFHEAAWPYARRDMYYDPARIEEEFRQPYSYTSILPGQSSLGEGGINGNLANAVHEGGPRNGVLTAVEDFISEWPDRIDLRVLPFFHGLGILVPGARMTPELASLLDSFFSRDGLLASCQALEDWSIRLQIELQNGRIELVRRTEALERARQLLAERGKRLRELETPQDHVSGRATGIEKP
jgi:hypothetical protein